MIFRIHEAKEHVEKAQRFNSKDLDMIEVLTSDLKRMTVH